MRRDARDIWPDDAPPGTFDLHPCSMVDRPSITARIEYVCPNGQRCGVLLGPAFEARRHEDEPNVWGWDGNMDRPSITPSINCVTEYNGKPTGNCGWHGFITEGVMR